MDNQMVEEYSHLIYKLAHSFTGYQSKEDLYQVGYKGLIQAYQHFNPNMGVKFSTYAYQYIFGEMSKLVREDYGVKVSRNLRKMKSQIEKVKMILSQELMHEPTDEEILNYLDISTIEFQEAIEATSLVQSFDQPMIDEGKELTLYDIVPSNELDIETRIALKQELENLTSLERKIIEDRYLKDLSQQEVATLYGMTQVQVSREEKKIKAKIRAHMNIGA